MGKWRARALAVVTIGLLVAASPSADAPAFDASFLAQSAYLDLAPGERGQLVVAFRNTGRLPWIYDTDAQVDLAVCERVSGSCGVTSPFASWGPAWLGPDAYATQHGVVHPGGVGVFTYRVRVPADAAVGLHISLEGELVVASTGRALRPAGYRHELRVVEPRPWTLAVAPRRATLGPGDELDLHARAFDAMGRPVAAGTVEWTVEGPAEVDAGGVLVAGDRAGAATVRARVGRAIGFGRVVVVPGSASVAVSPRRASVEVGETLDLHATVRDRRGRILPATVDWSVVGVGSVDASGRFRSDAPGGASVVGSAGAAQGTARVEVLPRPSVPRSLSVAPSEVELGPGDVQRFTASVRDAFGRPMLEAPVEWSVQGPGSIDAHGVYTATADPQGGTAQVTARSGTASGTALVTIVPADVSAIEVTPAEVELDPDDTQRFKAVVLGLAGEPLGGAAVTWSLSGVGVIDAEGLYVASDADGGGTAVVTATALGVSGTAMVTVRPLAPTTILVEPDEVVLAPGAGQRFTATVLDQRGDPLTAPLEWSVDGPGSIDQTGLYTAHESARGLATIHARSGEALGSALVDLRPPRPPRPRP